MVDFSSYRPPGVYVEDITGPVVSPFGIPVTTVCIIGPATGFQMYSEVILIPASGSVALNKQGVFTEAAAGHPAPVVKTLSDGVTLTEDTDYTFTDIDGTDPDGQIVGIEKAGLVSPGSVIVTYAYATTGYYAPQEFTDYDSVVSTYGAPMASLATAATQVTSPLSLAAKIAIENGANRLILVATNPVGGDYAAALRTAYDQVLADVRVNVVVPLLVEGGGGAADAHTSAVVQGFTTDLIAHCVASTNEGYGRVGIVGVDRGFVHATEDPFLALAAIAEGTGNGKRCVIAYPNLMNYYNGMTNKIVAVDGSYLAAAYAGRLSAVPVQKSLTKEVIRGFAGVPASILNIMTRSFKDLYSKNGIAVSEVDRQNRTTIRHGVSTDMSSILTREISIVRARDVLFEMCQVGTEAAGLIGAAIDEDTPIQVKAAVVNVLESALVGGVIVDYTNVVVRQQKLPPGDPSIIEVKFVYLPAIPLNYIVVQFAVDLNSGTTTIIEQAA